MPAMRKRAPLTLVDQIAEQTRALFGANFRQARIKANLTQADIEQYTGVRQHYISELENGRHNLTIDTMTVLACAVGRDIRTLLKSPSKKA